MEIMTSEPLAARFVRKVSPRAAWVRQLIGETTAMYVLMVVGLGVIIQTVVFDGMGNFVTISVCWGVAIAFGVMVGAKSAGGHLNPAVTIAMVSINDCTWRMAVPLILGQFLGAFLATLTMYGLYYQAIGEFAADTRKELLAAGNSTNVEFEVCMKVARLFTSFPEAHFDAVSVGTLHATCIVDTIFTTALLIMGALIIFDEVNFLIPESGKPALMGAWVTALVTAFAGNCGAPMNSARDFAPRLVVALLGQGECAFSGGSYYFYIPIIFTTIGGVLGAWFYKFTITAQLPPPEKEMEQLPAIAAAKENGVEKESVQLIADENC